MPSPASDRLPLLQPSYDGDIKEYVHPEAAASQYFNKHRKIIFINGMANSPADHAKSAFGLSFMQMCTVVGVYNKSEGAFTDFLQCIGDKNQFNGASLSAQNKVGIGTLLGGMPADVARNALSRNACQVALFNLLMQSPYDRMEIFAHSQGNLIVSNVLQAIAAVRGPAGVTGKVVNTFGSPSANWPAGLVKRECGFTFDPVTWLAGLDTSFSISKLGMPKNSSNPITHAFGLYMENDPAFVVNRFRVGGWGMTFNMDEDGLAGCLFEMGNNLPRVKDVFQHLYDNHNSDVDDVAEIYLQKVEKVPLLLSQVKGERSFRDLLIRSLDEGYTTNEEKRLIEVLKA